MTFFPLSNLSSRELALLSFSHYTHKFRFPLMENCVGMPNLEPSEM